MALQRVQAPSRVVFATLKHSQLDLMGVTGVFARLQQFQLGKEEILHLPRPAKPKSESWLAACFLQHSHQHLAALSGSTGA